MANKIIIISIIMTLIILYAVIYYSSDMPLINAITDNNITYVENKLKEGLDPNHVIKETSYYKYFHRGVAKQPIFWFSQTSEMVELFLKYGAEIDKEHSSLGWTLLSKKAYTLTPQSEKIIRTLLEHGANPFHLSSNGHFDLWAKLFHDRDNDNNELLKLLMEYIKDINKVDDNGDTILIYQISACHKRNVDNLLTHGSDPYIRNKNGENAFDIEKKVNCKEEILSSLSSLNPPSTPAKP